MENIDGRTKVRKAQWVEFIAAMNPEYHVTLTFTRRLSDEEAIASVSHFLRMVVACAPRKSKRTIRGVISAERNRAANTYLGHYHFHILLKGINGLFLNPLLWLTNVVLKCASKLRTLLGKPLCNTESVTVQSVYDAIGIARYLTKDVRYPFDRLANNLWPFDYRGVAGCLPDTKS